MVDRKYGLPHTNVVRRYVIFRKPFHVTIIGYPSILIKGEKRGGVGLRGKLLGSQGGDGGERSPGGQFSSLFGSF